MIIWCPHTAGEFTCLFSSRFSVDFVLSKVICLLPHKLAALYLCRFIESLEKGPSIRKFVQELAAKDNASSSNGLTASAASSNLSNGSNGSNSNSQANLRETWAGQLLKALEAEQARPDAPFRIRDLQIIQAEVGRS